MVRTAFPYPGGKSQYAPWIAEKLPSHTCYVEVFGGSGAVLFNKTPSQIEVYNDLDGDIPHFFRVLRDRGDELREFLREVEFSAELYRDYTRMFYRGWRPADDVERAAVFFFNRYAQWGGKYEGISGFARSAPSSSGRDKAKSWVKQVEQVEEFQERLNETDGDEWPDGFEEFRDRTRQVLIDNLDYADVFEKYDADNDAGDGTVFYCDPPYIDTEHRYAADGFDHTALVDALLDLDASWIVSYGTEIPPRLEQFRVEQRGTTRGIDRVNSDGKEAHETLVMNYPERKEGGFSKAGSTGDALDNDWGDEDDNDDN